MKVIVNPHSIQVFSTPVNELEINVTKVEFEFSEEITDAFVKEAYFTLDDDTYKQIIINNQCDIPNEVLTKVGTIELGVVAYLVDNEQEIQRYNPKPGYFTSWKGSLKDAENSQPITPSEMEQYEQALQDGLSQVANVDIDASKVGDTATITITNRQGTQKQVQVRDGETGERGPQGIPGPAGQTGPAGRDGVDGVSPTASVSKSDGTATITITDKNGTTTTTISDGVNGTNGTNGRDGYVQYTAGDNIIIENNVISATGGGIVTSIHYKDVYTSNTYVHMYRLRSYLDYDDITMGSAVTEAIKNAYNDAKDYFETGFNIIRIESGEYTNTAIEYTINWQGSKPTGWQLAYVSLYSTNFFGRRMIQFLNTYNGDDISAISNYTVSNDVVKGLAVNNVVSYTPTSNYNPATKKYVDDAITSAITTTLGGNY